MMGFLGMSDEQLKEFGQKALALLEPQVEKLINDKSDLLVKMAFDKLKVAIPGPFDDMLLDKILPDVQREVKEELLKQAEKISPLV